MRIGILSQWFDPEPGPASIPGVLARELERVGHEVSVLTGFPNYPEGRIFDGYRQRIRSREQVGSIRVTRVPLHASHSSSALGRVANYGTFAISATVLGARALSDTDAVWVYNSPVTVALPLASHTGRGRKPYFLQVQDLWPDSLVESGMFGGGGLIGRAAIGGVRRAVRSMERNAAAIGVSSPSARDLILERDPTLDPARVIYSPNPTDESLFHPWTAGASERLATRAWAGTFVVMYVGAVGDVQGLDSLLDAARILLPEREISVVIVGDGIARERLESRARAEGLVNVHFEGRIDKLDVPEYMSVSALQLVALADRPFLRHTMPSKIASILASRLPILGQIAGDGAQVIRESGAGWVAHPGDPEELAAAILTAANTPAAALQTRAQLGRDYYLETMSAEATAAETLRALSLGGSSAS